MLSIGTTNAILPFWFSEGRGDSKSSMKESALEITTGQELLRFDLGTVTIARTSYTVLTGFEGAERRCFWCGGPLKGKQKRYCYGHMTEYYRHFEWSTARDWCCARQQGLCANCGTHHGRFLEVHHIVPLRGESRYFSAFNLPWNLTGFCHQCHLEVHAVMRPPKKTPPTGYDERIAQGQLPLSLVLPLSLP